MIFLLDHSLEELMDASELCKHRWSTVKRIFITQNHWIEVQHCRKKCQQDRQVEYHARTRNGQILTESVITDVNTSDNRSNA